MTDAATTGPVAVPQATPEPATATQAPAAPQAGIGVAPPAAQQESPPLTGFAKIQAELREREDTPPLTIPFGKNDTIRIHARMSAAYLVDIAEATTNPAFVFKTIKDAIIADDHEKYETAVRLPKDNDSGVDADYLIALVGALEEHYSGVPLGDQSR